MKYQGLVSYHTQTTSYVQAPYQEVDKETFRKALKETPQLIEFEELIEEDDNTEGSQRLACTVVHAEIV